MDQISIYFSGVSLFTDLSPLNLQPLIHKCVCQLICTVWRDHQSRGETSVERSMCVCYSLFPLIIMFPFANTSLLKRWCTMQQQWCIPHKPRLIMGVLLKRGCFLGIQTLQVCETLHFKYRKISSPSNLVSCDNERKKEMKLGKGKKERNKEKPDKSGPS